MLDARRSSRALCVVAAALLMLASSVIAHAQPAGTLLEGVWSKDLDTCSLTDDEDETRLTIERGELKDYEETCRIGNVSVREDGSSVVGLQCGGRNAARLMRVFPQSVGRAVFYLPENKRPRSRDMMRCPLPLPDILQPSGDPASYKWNEVREPRRLIKLWLDARQRCRSGVSVAREEACAERRELGARLRSMRLCHVTRGSREGWRACG